MVVVMEYAGGENDEDMFITILRTMMMVVVEYAGGVLMANIADYDDYENADDMVVVEYAGGVLMARGGWSGAIFVEHRLVRGRSSNHSIFVFVFIFFSFFVEHCSATHQSQK